MVLKSPLSSLQIPDVPIHTAFFKACDTINLSSIALIDAVTDRHYTYGEVLDSSKCLGSGLAKHGVKKGDVIAVFSYNCPEWIMMMFGALSTGATITTANHTYTKYELVQHIQNTGAIFVVAAQSLAPTALLAAKECPLVKYIFVFGYHPGCISYDLLRNDDGSRINELEMMSLSVRDDVAFLPTSSGTTGVPKAVMLTHYNVIANLTQWRHPALTHTKPEGYQARILQILPLYHVRGLVLVGLRSMLNGQCLVILPKFFPELFLQTIEKYKVTNLPLVPSLVVFLMKSPLTKKYDLSSIEACGSGGAPLSVSSTEEFKSVTKIQQVTQGYGLSETTCSSTNHRVLSPSPKGSVGILLPNSEGKIVDIHTGKELGPGERGEICLRGPHVMKGYLNNPDATREAIDKEGWLHTGDIGYYDDHENFYVIDRIKEMIKVKGFQVAPAELEALLLTHPQIQDAGVTGITDEKAGELPKAFVVVKPGQHLSEDQVKNFVADRLAPFKHLNGGVQFVDSIPKLPTGKIMRRKLHQIAETSVHSKL